MLFIQCVNTESGVNGYDNRSVIIKQSVYLRILRVIIEIYAKLFQELIRL